MNVSAVITVSVTLLVALLFWRAQALGKRQMEIAEDILMSVQMAIDAIDQVRAPFVASDEIKKAAVYFDGRSAQIRDSTGEKGRSLSYLTYLHRLHERAGEFAPIQRHRVLARYFISPKCEQALVDLLDIRAQLNGLAETAKATTGPGVDFPGAFDQFLQRVNVTLFKSTAGEDEISKRLLKIRLAVEDACTRHIRRSATFWPTW
jgi:hypothetical protein